MQKIASIIVLTTSFANQYTRRCLSAIETNTRLPYELFVLRDERQSFGFSKNNNRIIKVSEGKYIVLVNDDCFVDPGWLDQMVEKAEEDHRIGIVGARLFGSDGVLQYGVDRAGADGDIESVAFALVLIKREVLEKIGLLNEFYRYGSEDSEFCYKALKSGFRCVISKATATHIKNMNQDSRALIMRSRGSYFLRRSVGQSNASILPNVAYDSIYPIRRFIMRKAPHAFDKLKKIKEHFFWRFR